MAAEQVQARQREPSRADRAGPSPGAAARRGGSQQRPKPSSSSGSTRRSEQEFDDYSIVDPKKIPEGPDVLLDVPVVKVDEIDLEVEDLHAQVAVLARRCRSWSS